jgi:hypothetical protein
MMLVGEVDKHRKRQADGEPDHAPGDGRFHMDFVGFALIHAQVQDQEDDDQKQEKAIGDELHIAAGFGEGQQRSQCKDVISSRTSWAGGAGATPYR